MHIGRGDFFCAFDLPQQLNTRAGAQIENAADWTYWRGLQQRETRRAYSQHMVRAGYVIHEGGIDVGEDEPVSAHDGVGADVEGNVGHAVGVGKRNLGIQQLGSQARSYGLTQKRGRQVLVQEEKRINKSI